MFCYIAHQHEIRSSLLLQPVAYYCILYVHLRQMRNDENLHSSYGLSSTLYGSSKDGQALSHNTNINVPLCPGFKWKTVVSTVRKTRFVQKSA